VYELCLIDIRLSELNLAHVDHYVITISDIKTNDLPIVTKYALFNFKKLYKPLPPSLTLTLTLTSVDRDRRVQRLSVCVCVCVRVCHYHIDYVVNLFAGRNLFQRAIIHGGSALSTWSMTSDPLTYARQLAERVNCTGSGGTPVVSTSSIVHTADILNCLKLKPADELVSYRVKSPYKIAPFDTPFAYHKLRTVVEAP